MTAAKRKAIAIMAAVLVILAMQARNVEAQRVSRHNRQQPVSRITRAPDAPTSITHRRYSSPSAVSTPIPLAEVPTKRDGRAGRSRR